MRRHPDLIVHRISKQVLHNSQKDKEPNFPAKHSSFSSESGGHEFNRAEKLGSKAAPAAEVTFRRRPRLRIELMHTHPGPSVGITLLIANNWNAWLARFLSKSCTTSPKNPASQNSARTTRKSRSSAPGDR